MALCVQHGLHMKPSISRETVIDRRQPQLRWSPIIGGAILATGVWILLQVLGTGVGLAAVDTDDAGSLRGAGIGTGIWSIIAPLIAMFVGGLLVGRTSGTRDRKVGGMHASVMWALALCIGLYAMMSLMGALVGGVTRVAGVASDATSSVVEKTVKTVDASDMIGPINERLRQQGKPAITEQQLDATIKALAQKGLGQGKLDREMIVQEVARNTALSRADAEEVATALEAKYKGASDQLSQLGEGAKEVGLQAADKTGKALMLAGLMMLLSLGAAVGGGMLGIQRYRREEVLSVESTL